MSHIRHNFNSGDGTVTIQPAADSSAGVLTFGENIEPADLRVYRSGENLVMEVIDSDPVDRVTILNQYSSTPSIGEFIISSVSYAHDRLYVGSEAADMFGGSDSRDLLYGNEGNDSLEGGAGADVIDGGAGMDTASYAGSASGVRIALGAGTGSGGDAEGDTLTSIENLRGSDQRDTLWGDANANRLDGGADDDTLGGGAGADVLDGGAGMDTASYGESTSGVRVDLAAGTGSGGNAEGDTLTSIENLHGSGHADTLTGDGGVNELRGSEGDDVLEGGAGADTLHGGRGVDTASYAGSASGVQIDLAAGTGSGGDAEGDTLTSIENLRGSDHGDTLWGDANANRLEGGAGADTLGGDAGADVLDGGAGTDTASYGESASGVRVDLAAGTGSGGNAEGDTLTSIENLRGSGHADTLTGDVGANMLSGSEGDDVLEGGAGADTLHGGGGVDTASYAGSASGVRINLATGTSVGGDAEGDTWTSIENLRGSDHIDVLRGDAGVNRLEGGAGDDRLGGAAGADVLDGGAGTDMAFYGGSVSAVQVDLGAGTASGGDAEGDTLIDIENLRGSEHADTLTGDAGVNMLWGKEGDDVLTGGAGADVLGGGEGVDTMSYAGSASGVRINLEAGTSVGGDAQGDTWTSIENLRGSDHIDVLRGDAGVNRLEGGAGDDRLGGGAGADVIDGGAGVDRAAYGGSASAVQVNLATGTASGGDAEGDTLIDIENLRGSEHADTLTGDGGVNELWGKEGDDRLEGGAGADTLRGGEGVDRVVYTGSARGVRINLAAGTASGGDAQGDTLTDIENLRGSEHADTLTGDAGVNDLAGAAGDDVLEGGAGADRLRGGRGDDLLYGGIGDDLLYGGAGADTLRGGAGNDLLGGRLGDDFLYGGAGDGDLAYFAEDVRDHHIYSTSRDGLYVRSRNPNGEGRDWVANDVEYVAFGDHASVAAGEGIRQIVNGGRTSGSTIVAQNEGAVFVNIEGRTLTGLRGSIVGLVGAVNEYQLNRRTSRGGDGYLRHHVDITTRSTGQITRLEGQSLTIQFADQNEPFPRISDPFVPVPAPVPPFGGGSEIFGGGGGSGDLGGGGGIGKPIILDLGGDGFDFVGIDDSNIRFDFTGDGIADRTAWLGAEDAFLAFDKDLDGLIKDTDELMLSTYAKEEDGTDLDGLRRFDSNLDNVFDGSDEQWEKFGLWRDLNQNGITDVGEFQTLEEAGILSIGLVAQPVAAPEIRPGEAVIFTTGDYQTIDGKEGGFADAALPYVEQSGDAPRSAAEEQRLVELLIQTMAALQPAGGVPAAAPRPDPAGRGASSIGSSAPLALGRSSSPCGVPAFRALLFFIKPVITIKKERGRRGTI